MKCGKEKKEEKCPSENNSVIGDISICGARVWASVFAQLGTLELAYYNVPKQL